MGKYSKAQLKQFAKQVISEEGVPGGRAETLYFLLAAYTGHHLEIVKQTVREYANA